MLYSPQDSGHSKLSCARYAEKLFTLIIEICCAMETPLWHPSAEWTPETNVTEKFVTEVCYESVNLSLEELKNN